MKKEINVKNDLRGCFSKEIIETIMDEREIFDIENFLNPPLEEYMYPLEDLKNIEKGAEIVFKGMKEDKKFGVYADVDLDGQVSSTIIKKYLNFLAINPTVYCNKGKTHGVTDYNLVKIIEDKIDILIIVDSLDGDINNYKLLKENGIIVLTIDHHNIDSKIPYDKYITLISSQDDYRNPHLCGAGTAWKFTKYLDECLGTDYADELVDLAMAGTIGDMVDISAYSLENRAIVNEGLNNVMNITLKRLGGGFEWNAKTVSFGAAPRVNACMRLSKNEYAVNAFMSDNDDDIKKYVKLLNGCRDEQNAEVDRIYDDAIEQCENQSENKMLVVVVDSKYSINGLLGNRLLNIYNKPVLILTERFGSYQGSMRAVGVDNFRQMLEDTGLCIANGHEAASGVEIKYEDFDAFREIIEEKLSHIKFETGIYVDAQINIDDVDNNLINMTKRVDRISGMGFPSLTYLIEIDDYTVEKLSNNKHLCIRTPNMLFIKWNFNDDDMYERLQDAELLGDTIRCWGNLDGSFVYKTYNKMILDDFEIVD